MRLTLDEIILKTGTSKFGTIIDLGCGEDRSYMPELLRTYCSKVIGVDIVEKSLAVPGLDDYIQVPREVKESYFDTIASGSIDAAFIINITGAGEHFTWQSWFSSNRVAQYLTEMNFLRIMKSGAFLIGLEWCSFPHKLVGEKALQHVNTNIETYFPSPQLPSFEKVASGYSSYNFGPFVVYRRI